MGNIVQLSIKIGITLSMLLGTMPPSHAQQQRAEKVRAFADTAAVTELFSDVRVGFAFYFPDQSVRSTQGLLGGKIPWKKIQVRSSQGRLEHGRLHFIPEKVWHNHHQLEFRVTFGDTTYQCRLSLPYLETLHFNLYTDSLKRGEPFYLNVEGQFSSGKIYPLDADQLYFRTSGGQLEGNTLEVQKTDTAAVIKVSAYFKWDNRLADSILVPVKTYVAPVNLPTEKELMEQWEHERRQGRRGRSR